MASGTLFFCDKNKRRELRKLTKPSFNKETKYSREMALVINFNKPSLNKIGISLSQCVLNMLKCSRLPTNSAQIDKGV